MKNKIINHIIKAGFAGGMFLSFALTASAVGTWTSPTGAPPTNNTDTPVNVGSTTQRKIGAFEIGNPSSTTPNGLAVYGQSALIKKVTIGVVPCSGLGCYSGSYDTSSTTTTSGIGGAGAGGGGTGGGGTAGGGTAGGTVGGGTYTTGGWIVPKLSSNNGNGFFSSLRNAFANTFKPEPVYAVGTTAECAHSYDYPGSPCTVYSSTGVVLGAGTCVWNDTGSLYCSSGTTSGGSGGVGSTTGSSTATLATPPTISFNPTSASISSGSAGSIVWSVSNASTCAVGSANPSNNWTPSSVSISSSTHAGSGTKSLGTFTNPGSYSYYMTCTSPSGASATSAATITVGPTYILETYGNANINGYLNVTANVYSSGFKQGGVNVCLQNGTNCPASGGYSSVFPIGSNPSSAGTQGAWIGWNALTGGTGETDFINNKGGGSGGFAFMNQAYGSSTRSTLMMITGSGAVGIGTTSPSADLEVSGTSNRNTPLLKVTSSGTANGDNSANTERGITVAASSAAGQGKLLNVKRGSTDLFNVAGNGNTYIQHSVIGPAASGDGVPMYRLNPHCASTYATNSIGGRYYNLPLTTQKWCGENDNLWYNDKNAPATYVAGAGTPGPHYYAGKLNHSSGTCTYSAPTGGGYLGCDYNPTPVGYLSLN